MERSVNCSSLVAALICLAAGNSVIAQQPGGVDGTKLWYVATRHGVTNTLVDTSGNRWTALDSSSGDEETLTVNFHPAVYVEDQTGTITYKNFAFPQGTIAAIFYPDSTHYANRDYFRIGYNRSKISLKYNEIDTNETLEYKYGNPALRTTFDPKRAATKPENSMKVGMYYRASQQTFTSVWGEDKTTTLFSGFRGFLPELIIYDRVLTLQERSKVESYLAIKYGITLDSSYIGTSDKPLWDINDPNLFPFHHRVCAIGKDSKAAIRQQRSNTTYEEMPYSSYEHNSDDVGNMRHSKLIPKLDSPSLYRSLTIGYSDRSLNSVAEGSYLFWGDDSLSIDTLHYYPLNTQQYPYLKVVQRNWLMYNQSKAQDPTKISVAGKDYKTTDDPINTLFSNLYHPYDYQLYRFVLIKMKTVHPLVLDTMVLCTYFGREQFENENFDTRTIVWDSVLWKASASYNYFTFGKLPLLNFLQIGKAATQLSDLEYPYHKDSAIKAETDFDLHSFAFSAVEPLKIYFKISRGMPKITASLYKIVPAGPPQLIKNAITADVAAPPPGPPSPVAAPSGAPENPTTGQSTDDESAALITEAPSGKMEYIERRVPVKKQASFGYNVKLPDQPPGSTATYIIVVVDKFQQRTTIPVQITRQLPTPPKP
jgi:hypothetical protein